MIMKRTITILSSVLGVALLLASCVKEEKIEIQSVTEPASEEEESAKADYYSALRTYKESDHILSYVFMGRYATLEGASNLNVEYTTMEYTTWQVHCNQVT